MKAWRNPPTSIWEKHIFFPSIWFSKQINAISSLRIKAQFSKPLSHWLINGKITPFGIRNPQIPEHVCRVACDACCSLPGPGSPVLTTQNQFLSLLLDQILINPDSGLFQQIYRRGPVGRRGWSGGEYRGNQKPVHWRVCTNIRIPNLDKVPLKCFFVSWS